MSFLYFLEGLRTPVLDTLFSIITRCGEETIFMAIGMVVFWCVNKYQGYYLLSVGFVGTVINQFLKMVFRIPRPWIKDPAFTIVESAREAASGYSFPSGHTQTAVGLFGGLARANRGAVLRGISVALCVLVPLSRMYLGVHTPLDVGVSIGIALLLIFAVYPLFMKAEHSPRTMYTLLCGALILVIAFTCYVNLFPFPEEVYVEPSLHNLLSAQKNAATLTGCLLGFLVVYTVDLRYVRFDTRAVWWAQIIKTVVGLALVLAAKELLKLPLNALLPEYPARMVRYFLLVIVGGILWPMTFRFFGRLGRKKDEM